jgi:hypothetical protein
MDEAADSARTGTQAAVGCDQQWATPRPINQDAGDQAEHQIGQPPRRVDQSDAARPLVQGDDDQNLDRERCDVGPNPETVAAVQNLTKPGQARKRCEDSTALVTHRV